MEKYLKRQSKGDKSGHGHAKILEGVQARCSGGRVLVLGAHVLRLLHDLFEPVEEDLEDADELAAVDEVDFGDSLGLEDAGEEADGHVVVAHLVKLLSRNHFLLEENQQVEDDPAIKVGKVAYEVQHEVHLLFLLDRIVADDHHDAIVDVVGHNRVHQLREELLHYSCVGVAAVVQNLQEAIALAHLCQFLDDLLLLLNRP